MGTVTFVAQVVNVTKVVLQKVYSPFCIIALLFLLIC
jgi:hypothetical protein